MDIVLKRFCEYGRMLNIVESLRGIAARISGVSVLGNGADIDLERERPVSERQFFEMLASLVGALPRSIDSLIFIIDEASHCEQTGERLAFRFLRAVSNQDGHWKKPQYLSVILLPYPEWQRRFQGKDGDAPYRDLHDRPFDLKPFTIVESEELVHRLHENAGWETPPGAFVERLHILSGGYPELLQAIGYWSCEATAARGRVEMDDLDSIVDSEHPKILARVESVINSAGFPLQDYRSTVGGRAVLGAFSLVALSSNQALEGFRREEWDSKLRPLTLSHHGGVHKAWQDLEDSSLIIAGERIRFRSEAVRRLLRRLVVEEAR